MLDSYLTSFLKKRTPVSRQAIPLKTNYLKTNLLKQIKKNILNLRIVHFDMIITMQSYYIPIIIV